MAKNRGKEFEAKFRQNWKDTVPNSMCYRLYDTMNGFKSIGNAGDCICFKSPYCFIIDCKSVKGNTFSADFRQYDRMAEYKGIDDLHCGVVIWFIEHPGTVVWVPFETFEKIKANGLKSFNVKMIGDPAYPSVLLDSVQHKVFCDTDYSKLITYYDNERRALFD